MKSTVCALLLLTVPAFAVDMQQLRVNYEAAVVKYDEVRAVDRDLSPLVYELIPQIKSARESSDWNQLWDLLLEFDAELVRLLAEAATFSQPGYGLTPESDLFVRKPLSDGMRTLISQKGLAQFTDQYGATGRNLSGFSDVAGQRDALWTLRYALTDGNSARISDTVRAMVYGFAFQKTEGNFLNLLGVTDIQAISADAFFMTAYSHIFSLLEETGHFSGVGIELQNLLDNAEDAMDWLLDHRAELEWQDGATANRLAQDGLAFLLNGQLLNRTDLINVGEDFIQLSLDMQRPDGVLEEEGGYDSSYQAVCILNLCIAWHYVENPVLKADIYSALASAVSWEKTRVLLTGEISVEGNTRTGLNQEEFFGVYKDVNYAEVALAFYYWADLSGDLDSIAVADRIVGFSFE